MENHFGCVKIIGSVERKKNAFKIQLSINEIQTLHHRPQAHSSFFFLERFGKMFIAHRLLTPSPNSACSIQQGRSYSSFQSCTCKHSSEYCKMTFFLQDLHTDILLEEVRGKQQPAVHVFAMSLRYMKEHLLRAMKTNLEFDPDPLTIRWVLTVPAIWDENSKQFMREAAHRVIYYFPCIVIYFRIQGHYLYRPKNLFKIQTTTANTK